MDPLVIGLMVVALVGLLLWVCAGKPAYDVDALMAPQVPTSVEDIREETDDVI